MAMDQRLIAALENVGLALEEIADALKSKEESKSSSVNALKAGDFGKQLESISTQLKSIKADTQEILKQQKTIVSLSKEKGKTPMDEIGSDPKKESAMKKGIGTILLIAVAVLAIGMAFKLVGEVNVLSVISLGLAMYVVSLSFEKIAALKMSLKDALVASITMVTMATAITLSSHIMANIAIVGILQILTAIGIAAAFATIGLSLEKLALGVAAFDKILGAKAVWVAPLMLVAIATAITFSSHIMANIAPIGIAQGVTAILIAATFAVIGISLDKIAMGISSVDEIMGKKAAWLFPLMLVAIAAAITASSYLMTYIQPVGIWQALTAIFIALTFTIIGFTIEKLAASIATLDKTIGKKAEWLFPLMLVAIATAITLSSWAFSLIVPIKLDQFFTALGIALLFGLMSFVMMPMALGIAEVDKTLGKGASFLIPAIFVALSLAIMLSSHILAETLTFDEDKIKKIVIFGVAFAIMALAMMPAMLLVAAGVKKLGVVAMGLAVLGLVLIAGAIMVSSHILSVGEYGEGKYPSAKWALSVGTAIALFGLSTIALGLVAVTGIGAIAILAGAVAVPIVAASIMASSKIISRGKYDNAPGISWAISVGSLMTIFGLAVLTLGSFIVGTLGLGYVALMAGRNAVKIIAQSIVDTADILAKGSGNWAKGPTKEWASGVAIAIGAFSPIYRMLMANNILKLFGGGGVGPKDFATAIRTISQGIVDAASFFANNTAAFVGGPSKEWSEGVGKAIGAFAPVYRILADEKGLFGTGVSIEQFKQAIITISEGIVASAEVFQKNKSKFDEGNYPSVKWGQGVGAALKAFSPVFKSLSEDTGWFTSGDEVINNMVNGVKRMARAIVSVAKIFAWSKVSWDSYPSKKWSYFTKVAIKSYVGLSKYVEKVDADYWAPITVANRMVSMAKALYKGEKYFQLNIDPNYIKKVSKNMLDFNEMVKKLKEGEDSSIFSRIGESAERLLGTDPISQIAKRMVTLAKGYDALATSLIKLGGAMKALNVSDARSLSGITRSMAEAGPLKLEEKGPGAKISKIGGSVSQIKDVDRFKEKQRDDARYRNTVMKKMNEVIKILKSIDRSVSSVDDYISDKSDGNYPTFGAVSVQQQK